MSKVVLASVVALLVGFSVGTTANAWPNFDILPDPNLEDLNDFPDGGSDRDIYDEAREQLEESRRRADSSADETRRLLDESRRVSDWDFDDDGVMDDYERYFAFERDVDGDGFLDYQDPDESEINYMLRLPGGYDYDEDGLFDDDPRDRVYGRDRVPDPDPDPDPEMQYQYQETTVQEETTVAEETTQEETTAAEESTAAAESTAQREAAPNPDDGIGPFWGGLLWLYELAKGIVLVAVALTVVLGAVVAAIGAVARIIGATGVTLLLMGAVVYVVIWLIT